MKQAILLPLCFKEMASKRKYGKRRSHQNLPHTFYLNCQVTQNIKTRKGAAKQRIIFFPGQQTQSLISHTIPKQQIIQELTNVANIKPLGIQSIRVYFRSRSNEFLTLANENTIFVCR